MQYLVSQRLTKRRLRQRRQHPEGSGGQNHAVGNQSMVKVTRSPNACTATVLARQYRLSEMMKLEW
jgi:hypothetical protein